MTRPFEDPAKTQLRVQCAAAIDAAGHRLIDPPERIDLPSGTGLRGGISPDVQSIDVDGYRFNYYVRPGGSAKKPIPQWLTNLARGASQLDRVLVYVLTDSASQELVESCRTVGAGLVLLRDGTKLDHLVDPRDVDPSVLSVLTQARITRARREMMTKYDLNVNRVEESYAQLRAALSVRAAGEYLVDAEQKAIRWREWSDNIAERLDAVAISGNLDELRAIEADIEAGID